MEEAKSDSAKMALVNTRLAYTRTRAASERTLMAWIRTSLSMISFGFSISTFFRSLRKTEGLPPLRISSEPFVLGLVLVGLGVVVLALGAVQEYLFLRSAGDLMKPIVTPSPWTYSLGVAMFMLFIGVAVFLYMVYKGVR